MDNLQVRIHFIIVMFRWTGLAPWQFEFPFLGSLTVCFQDMRVSYRQAAGPTDGAPSA
jgi:hypothetical protein